MLHRRGGEDLAGPGGGGKSPRQSTVRPSVARALPSRRVPSGAAASISCSGADAGADGPSAPPLVISAVMPAPASAATTAVSTRPRWPRRGARGAITMLGSGTSPVVVASSGTGRTRGAGGPSAVPASAARARAISAAAVAGRSAGLLGEAGDQRSSSAGGTPSRRPLTRGGGSLVCA